MFGWEEAAVPLLVPPLTQVTARRQTLDNICSQFYFCQTQTLLNLVLLTSPLFRMRVFMWHASDGRRKDTRKASLGEAGFEKWEEKRDWLRAPCEIGSFWKWRSDAGMWGMRATGAPPVLSGRGQPPTTRREIIILSCKSLVRLITAAAGSQIIFHNFAFSAWLPVWSHSFFGAFLLMVCIFC